MKYSQLMPPPTIERGKRKEAGRERKEEACTKEGRKREGQP
jgi:hypothetical protein